MCVAVSTDRHYNAKNAAIMDREGRRRNADSENR